MTKLGELLREQLAKAKQQEDEQTKKFLSPEEEATIRKAYRDRIEQTPAYKNTEASLSRLTGDESGVISYQRPGFFGRIFGKKPEPIEVGEEPQEVGRAQIEGIRSLNVEELDQLGVFSKWEHTNYQYPDVNLLVGPEGGVFVANSNPDEPSLAILQKIKLTPDELDEAVKENAGLQVRRVEDFIRATHTKRELTHKKETTVRALTEVDKDTDASIDQFRNEIGENINGDQEIVPTENERKLVNLYNEHRAEAYTDVEPEIHEAIGKIQKEEGLSIFPITDRRPYNSRDFKDSIMEVDELNSGAKLVKFAELRRHDGYTGLPTSDQEAFYMLVANEEDLNRASEIYGERLNKFRPDREGLRRDLEAEEERLSLVRDIINDRGNDISGNAEIEEIVNRHTGQGDDTTGVRVNSGPER